ncbi:MAG: hypothetical protein M3R66_16680 [Actinomycetota bacterium]|nr:hypothetical protein [Actinomycetota bacterium]
MADRDLAVGTTILRRELRERWGGGRYGGMEPAVEANSVFLFSQPSVGKTFGYVYDGWRSDGTFHYTGDGQELDQSPTVGGNRALLRASSLGRAIRLFRSDGRETTYLGAFGLGDPPYYLADAVDRNKEMRSVLVFRLIPQGEVLHDDVDAGPSDAGPEELPVEASDIDTYVMQRPDEPPVAVRREAKLVKRYTEWLAVHRRGDSTATNSDCRRGIPVH